MQQASTEFDKLLQSITKYLKQHKLLVLKTLLLLQALSISSRETPTGSSGFQVPHCRMDTHDPLLWIGWTVLTPLHLHPWLTSYHCLPLEEDRSSGSNGRRIERRRMSQQGWGTTGGTDMDVNMKTHSTEDHTSGHNALAKMELFIVTHLFLLPCWLFGHCWVFKGAQDNKSQMSSQTTSRGGKLQQMRGYLIFKY